VAQIERLHAERDEWKTLNSQRVDEIERLRGIVTGKAAEAEIARLRALVAEVIAAWDALPEGDYQPRRVERWLRENMHPAMNRARAALAAIAELHVINERNDA
jgi:hypothetical protein